VNYLDPNVKKVRTDERDVPKVDWYELSLDFMQVSVNQPSGSRPNLAQLRLDHGTGISQGTRGMRIVSYDCSTVS
jgi:hypothetical protein